MDFGDFLNTLQSPTEKFKIAVMTNDLAKLQEIVDQVPDINLVVDDQLNRRAIHIAGKNGNFEMILLLLERGVIVSNPDSLGVLPWHFSLNSGLQKAIRLILSQSPNVINMEIFDSIKFGNAGTSALPNPVKHQFYIQLSSGKRVAIAENSLSTFLKAINPGHMTGVTKINFINFLTTYQNVDIIIKLSILCGFVVPREDILALNMSTECRSWMENTFKEPWNLQAICRQKLRQNFKYNPFYSCGKLNIPPSLMSYIAMDFDDEYIVHPNPVPFPLIRPHPLPILYIR